MGNLSDNLSRDLFILEDENNPKTSQVSKVWPRSIIDQIFDPQSPTGENLRDIIKDLREEIKSGGIGNIKFPVTSVNGEHDDVTITPAKLGLGKVDNTKDIDKPLSTPQRNSIMDILAGYNFKINMDPFYNHMANNSNPHSVNVDQINKDDELTTFVNRLISVHNLSTERITHLDIRNSLSQLWKYVDDNINGGLDARINSVLGIMNGHITDPSAHHDQFKDKEDVANKCVGFTTVTGDHTKYPSTRAVVEFVNNSIRDFSNSIPNITTYIADIQTIETRNDLPDANNASMSKAYIIRTGSGSQNEIAVCRMNPDKTYAWEISNLGSVSKFNPAQFQDTADGLSINVGDIIDKILTKTGDIDTNESNILKDYYKKEEIDLKFIKQITILPGTMDGHIRYYINGDMLTMSDDIPIPGLKNLAYMEYVTEKEIRELAVQNRHLGNASVDSRVLADKCVKREHIDDSTYTPDLFKTPKMTLLGNIMNDDGTCHSVNLTQLGDLLRPIIGGWPDVNVPGIDTPILEVSPITWDVGKEYPFTDGSKGMRFKGTISVIPNSPMTTVLSTTLTSDKYQIIDAGGSWRTDSDAGIDALLGGSDVLGNTFANVTMSKQNLQLSTVSIGNRLDAPYDLWVRYVPINK